MQLTFLVTVAVALVMLAVVQAMPGPLLDDDRNPGPPPIGSLTPHPLIYDGE